MDKFHLIKVFVAVVDTGGFAGAARHLHMSPPAVTRAINELESQLGVRLLTRTTRIVRVTEPGDRYAQDYRRILADMADADESVASMHGAPRGRLVLSAPVLFGARYVTAIVTEYLQRYPQVSVSCWFLGRLVNMMEEGVDVAIRIADLPDSSMQAVRVGQVRRVICAAPSYLQRHGTPQHPDDLSLHRLIANSANPMLNRWPFMVDGQARELKVAGTLRSDNTAVVLAMALAGLGIARLNRVIVAPHVAQGSLLPLLQAHVVVLAHPIYAVMLPDRQRLPKVRVCVDQLAAWFAGR